MELNTSYVVYSVAVGWFTYHLFWMTMRIYQFNAFPRTYGTAPNLSLRDLADAAVQRKVELPSFKVVIPAYQEVSVIAATLKRVAAMNYPRTHFEVYVVTYEDEAADDAGQTTYSVVRRTAEEINRVAGLTLVHPLVVPATYDGFFPGNLNAGEQHIGKARGLNFAIRCIHESNERDERTLYVGLMSHLGHIQRIANILEVIAKRLHEDTTLGHLVARVFDPRSPGFLGPLAVSSQLLQAMGLANAVGALGEQHRNARNLLLAYINSEAPRFFMQLTETEELADHRPSSALRIMPGKEFLHETMRSVELRHLEELEGQAEQRMTQLARQRPLLHEALRGTRDPDAIFQLARKINSRWMMVYDADADAPVDIMRHLAGRIMTEPEAMGFQGPVAPLLNYDDVHPLCRMGGLWMAFWHGAAYPRLLHNAHWAHPLAGTNWCFRIDGFERDGQLIRDVAYDESRRRFVLSFDPTQLTEDLEAGIRNFSEWSLNAQWHPVVEMEQVPPTARAVFAQHARWALGTLQTMSYIRRSRLPLTQKVWFLMYPLRVIFASSGPFITGGLIAAVAAGWLTVEPIFAWWTLLLAFGNLIYVQAFVQTFQRYYDIRQHAAAVEYIHQHGEAILGELEHAIDSLDEAGISVLRGVVAELREGMQPGGFVTRYLQSRCTDDDGLAAEGTPADGEYLRRLLQETPYRVRVDHVSEFVRRLEDAALRALPRAGTGTAQGLSQKLSDLQWLVRQALTAAGASRRPRWSRYHTQILLWAIPFIYFSVTPFFNAFWRWSKGERGGWNKTARTPKF